MNLFILTATEGAAWLSLWPLDSFEQAEEIASRFPKSVKIRASHLSGSDDYYRDADRGIVKLDVKLAADGVNRGRNEAGIARLKRALATIEKTEGFEVEYREPYGNSITRERLDEILSGASS